MDFSYWPKHYWVTAWPLDYWPDLITGVSYTFDLHLTESETGNDIENGIVSLKDLLDLLLFEENTGVDGKIAQQLVVGQPALLTIIKTGFQDYRGELIINRNLDLEVAMLAAGGNGTCYLRRR